MSEVALLFMLASTVPLAGPGTLIFRPEARIAEPQLRLGDVADISMLPVALRRSAAGLVVATFGARTRQADLRSGPLQARARALMPALAPWLQGAADFHIAVHVDAPAPAALPPACLTILSPLQPGAFPLASDVLPAPCGAAAPGRAFRYDRQARAVRAFRALAPGDIVAAAPRGALAAVRPGDALFVTAQIGAVRIQRSVTALWPARDGRAVVVRGGSNAPFAVPFPKAGQ